MNTCYVIVNTETGQKQEMRFSKIDNFRKVLNTACKSFKIKPEKYEIRYAKRKLDLNVNLMFSALPDGVSLELSPVTEPEKVEKVVVNLIIGEGTVNSGTFPKTDTLLDVSKKLIPKDKYLEEDRTCISFLSKRFEGPKMLGRVRLSSLQLDGSPLNLSLTRKYSSEKLDNENEDHSFRRNSKTTTMSHSLGTSNILLPKTTGTSKASVNRQDSTVRLEEEVRRASLQRKQSKSNNDGKRKVKKNNFNIPDLPNSRLLKNTIHRNDKRYMNNRIEKSVSTNLKAVADIDKHFYLNPEKRLEDLKYLNSRKGITYVSKLPMGEIPMEESAVELLDLGRDSTRSCDGNVELKLFLPDQTTVQAMFRYDETVEDVHQFLNPLLQCQPSDYFLYLSNPMESVEKNISLNELEDSSGVNLYLQLKPKVKKVWPKCKSFLKKEHLPKKR